MIASWSMVRVHGLMVADPGLVPRFHNNLTLAIAHCYALSLSSSLVHSGIAAPRNDVVEASVVLSDAVKRLTRKLGANHPETRRAAHDLGTNRFILKTMDSTVEK